MKIENINQKKLKELEKRLGCRFCSDGMFAEMSLDIKDYHEKTVPIQNIEFSFCKGSIDDIKAAVAKVEEDWVQYFKSTENVFCGYCDGEIVSFCIIDSDVDCILSQDNIKVGSIGCVGTVPKSRKKGIGLRMVDLATVYLKNQKCDKAYIHYTHIDKWYAKLGYETFARFDI